MMSTSWLHSTTTSSTAFSIVQELTYQKLLKSVFFDRVIQKVKRWTFFSGGTHGIRYAPAVSDVVVDAGPARVQSYDSVAVLSVDVLSVCVLSVCVLSVGVLSVAVLSVGVVRPGRSTADHQPHRHGQLAAFAPENDASRRSRGPRRVAAQTTRQGPCVVFHIYVRVSLCPRAYLRNCAPIFTAKFLCLAALRTPGFRDDTTTIHCTQV